MKQFEPILVLAVAVLMLHPAAAVAQMWSMEPWDQSIGILDSVDGSNDGIMNGFPGDGSEWVVGRLGRSLEFDGANRSVTLPVTLNKTRGTVEHWVRPDSSIGFQILFYASDSPAAADVYNGFGLGGSGFEFHTGLRDGEFFAMYQDGGGAPNVSGSGRWEVQGGTVIPGQWTHVAFSWSVEGDSFLELWINGVLVDSVEIVGGVFAGHAVTEQYIGRASAAGVRMFDGLLDEVRVTNSDDSRTTPHPILSESAQLKAPVETVNELYGQSMTADGDTLIVGSDNDTYVYTRLTPTSWSLEKAMGFVGTTTVFDLSNDTFIGGTGAGAGVFERNLGGPDNWGRVAVLYNEIGFTGQFGRDVAIEGDLIVAGSPHVTNGNFYVFERNAGGPGAWGQVHRFFLGSEKFGSLVDIEGDVIAVADIYQVHIFYRNEGGLDAWGYVTSVNATGPDMTNIELRGDSLLISSSYVSIARRNLGGADQWKIEQRIRLDLEGEPPVINAVWKNDTQIAIARANYLYRSHLDPHVVAERIELWSSTGGQWQRSALMQSKEFNPAHEIAWSSMGMVMEVSGDSLLVGAPINGRTIDGADAGQINDAGRVLLFSDQIFADGFE